MRKTMVRVFLAVAAFTAFYNLDQVFAQSAQHIRSENVTLAGGRAGGSDLFVPSSGLFRLEYSVPGGKKVMITMITQAQYQEVAAGRKPNGTPLIKAIVTGSGTQTARISRGNYFIALNNQERSNTAVSYRAFFVSD